MRIEQLASLSELFCDFSLEQFDPLALASNHAPGEGAKARTCRSISVAGRLQSIRASALSIFAA